MPVAARIGLALFFALGAPRAQAVDLGNFDESIHENAQITFQFSPRAVVPTMALVLGMPSSLVPPSPGYLGCEFQLFDGGGLISSATITSSFGCQGVWFSDGTANSLLIDGNVDLSGIAAGEVGMIVLRPTFLGPGGNVNLNMPGLSLTGGGSVTILSQGANPIPEPSLAALFAAGLLALERRRRRAC